MASLLDVNVLLALMHRRHSHSQEAVEWLGTQRAVSTIVTCRVTQMGALRLLTSKAVMGHEVLSAEQAWGDWEKLLSDVRFSFVPEPDGLAARWKVFAKEAPEGSVFGTDAYLAAMALAGGWTLVTFDRAFGRFRGLSLEILPRES